jgi:hypothetical protein
MNDAVPLKERFEKILEEKDKALNAALISLNERLGLLNELRSGVATKDEIKALEKVVDDLKTSQNLGKGRSDGATWLWGILATSAGLIIGGLAVAIALKHSG